MGAELLVAILWGAVLVSWLWSRRPTTGDTVGSFRHELHVLEHATPVRVPPANRLRSGIPAFAVAAGRPAYPYESGALAFGPPRSALAAPLPARQLEVRRRRRDVLSVLSALVLLSLLAAFLTGSLVAFCLQGFTDLVLATYAYMLVRTTKAQRSGPSQLLASAERSLVPSDGGGALRKVEHLDEVAASDYDDDDVFDVRGYVPVHALAPRRWESSYGDFGSYASLAMAR